MATTHAIQPASSKGHSPLDPVERVMEGLFGIIMVLGFTGSLSAATAGKGEVQTMLYGAIGCNIAWGIVDAVMYVMAALAQRRRDVYVIRLVQSASSPEAGRETIHEWLPDYMQEALSEENLEHIRQVMLKHQPHQPQISRQDIRGAIAVFWLVAMWTLPVVVPFMIFSNTYRALRISNGVACVLLFCGGYALSRFTGGKPWVGGIAMVAIGLVLVAITVALGG